MIDNELITKKIQRIEDEILLLEVSYNNTQLSEQEQIKAELELDLLIREKEKLVNEYKKLKEIAKEKKIHLDYFNKYEKDFIDYLKTGHNEEALKLLNKFSFSRTHFHALCVILYKEELMGRHPIYSVQVPLNKYAYKILQERLDNIEEYKQIAKEILTEKRYQHDLLNKYGISDNVKVTDILKGNSNFKQEMPFPYEDEQLIEFLNCEKYKVLPSSTKKSQEGFNSTTNYYVGKVNNQNVLFYEKYSYLLDEYNNKIRKCSYNFGFFPNGNKNKFVYLMRADYDPKRSHINKTIGQYKLNTTKESIVQDNPPADYDLRIRNNAPAYSHFHLARNVYSVLYPFYSQGFDCVDLALNNAFYSDKEYNEIIRKNRPSKFNNYQEIEDYINRFGESNFSSFQKFVDFSKTITNVHTESAEKIIFEKLGKKKDFSDAKKLKINENFQKFLNKQEENKTINNKQNVENEEDELTF